MTVSDLFEPDSVAVVGASRSAEKIGHGVLANLRGFDGPVYPVNPNAEGELFGRPVLDSVTDAGDVDLALLCVPAPVVPAVVADCCEAGVGAAVVYSGGFAETDDDGRARERDLAATADDHGLALLGPNTSGFLVPGRDLYASFVGGVERVDAGDVAVVAQSGGVAHALAFQAVSEGRGLSAVVGLGNRANTGFRPVVEHFDADPATDAIALHLEGTEDARGLLETVAAAETPVVAYKVGREDVDEFAASHTGALTGDHALYEGGLRQYGVPTVDGTTRLLDAGVALAAATALGSPGSNNPVPAGPNVGVVVAQAGPGIVIADRLRAAGAELPPLAPATAETVEDVLPGITYEGNPVDTGRPMPEFGDVVAAVARDERVDVVLVYQVYEPALGYPVEALSGLPEETATPVLFATDGPESDIADDLAALEAAGVPAYRSPERGADAAAALVEWARRDGGHDGQSSDPPAEAAGPATEVDDDG